MPFPFRLRTASYYKKALAKKRKRVLRGLFLYRIGKEHSGDDKTMTQVVHRFAVNCSRGEPFLHPYVFDSAKAPARRWGDIGVIVDAKTFASTPFSSKPDGSWSHASLGRSWAVLTVSGVA